MRELEEKRRLKEQRKAEEECRKKQEDLKKMEEERIRYTFSICFLFIKNNFHFVLDKN